MTRVPALIARLVISVFALGVAATTRAQLATNSPFLPPQASSAAPTAGAPLEFGGYLMSPGGERLYRIKDPARKTSEWVKLNERNPNLDVTIKEYDETRNTVTIEHQGRTMTLAEREAKIVSAGTAPPPVPMPVPNPAVMPAAVTQAVVVNPTPADEQRRLEAVATEVARRRALREQATQQINQGVQPQIAMPQQPQPTFQQMPPGQNIQPNQGQRQNQQNPRQLPQNKRNARQQP